MNSKSAKGPKPTSIRLNAAQQAKLRRVAGELTIIASRKLGNGVSEHELMVTAIEQMLAQKCKELGLEEDFAAIELKAGAKPIREE
jgi:hypothetical protein